MELEISSCGLHINNQFEELLGSAGLPGFQKLYLSIFERTNHVCNQDD